VPGFSAMIGCAHDLREWQVGRGEDVSREFDGVVVDRPHEHSPVRLAQMVGDSLEQRWFFAWRLMAARFSFNEQYR